jgi:hypothetical protein
VDLAEDEVRLGVRGQGLRRARQRRAFVLRQRCFAWRAMVATSACSRQRNGKNKRATHPGTPINPS